LGVRISPDVKQIVPLNHDPLEMLNRWTRMPISMIGRINIIKMLVLPKFLFQSLPLPLPETFFHNINNILNQLIWNDKKARLQLKLLYLPYESLKLYYWAAQLRTAMYYFSVTSPPAWVTIEETSTLGLPLKLYLYSARVGRLVKQTKNPFSSKYHLPFPRRHFFKYLQLKHFILSIHKHLSVPPLSKIEKLTLSHMDGGGQFSLFYDLLLQHSKESSSKKMEAWISDLKEDIQEADWEGACFKAQTQSVNTKYKLLQYKWLMRTYLTPCRLNHIYPNVPDICVKCREEKGTLIHCLWECLKINQFWKGVLHYIGFVVGREVPLRAKICLLGIYPENFVVSQQHSLLIDFGL